MSEALWIGLAGLALALGAAGMVHLVWRARLRRWESEWRRRGSQWEAERQRLEETLERDRAGQMAVFDCMAEGLLLLDASRKVKLVNRRLRDWFAIGPKVEGRTLMETLRRHELEELAERARAEGQALGLELEVGTQSTRVLSVNAATFGQGDSSARGVILVFHDVTRLRELEETRREFVANVSHELRTPLALIKGYVETLIDGARNDPEVLLRFLQMIEKHSNRLTFLIEDLLTVSQLESGRIAMNLHWGDVHRLVGRVLEDLASRAAERGITCVNEVAGPLPVRADFDRLQQVVSNLVDNAIKYGRKGGRVVVSARVLDAEARLEIAVADDGPGIPPEALDRVFERFYRVDAARSREQGGTGLGLSIVKHIVLAHGGNVRAESAPGRGATFRVQIPWESAPAGVDATHAW
ncbi:MAG: PAS domain-containing sensor histidine kinase [Verrucomicrobiales bacterium]|nr:PAS domain-containing sensor histidine kinase [Verrucomicrobiales bacterium]